VKTLLNRVRFIVFICLMAAFWPGLATRAVAQSAGAKADQAQAPRAITAKSERFLGWKYASQQGREYLKQFVRKRANVVGSGASPSAVEVSKSRRATLGGTTPNFSTNPNFLPGFDFRASLPADFMPTAVATGDFNRDGKIDWAVANGGSNNVWIYLGNGDGTAAQPTVISLAGKSPVAVAAASLRGNGVVDLIVAEADSASIEVFLGNGDGTFGTGIRYPTGGTPSSLAVADFNGDGHLDVAVAVLPETAGAPAMVVFPGNGSGGLGVAVNTPATASLSVITNIVAGDLNGDGKPDIVAINGAEIAVLLNQGNGLFTLGQTIGGTGDFDAVALGDMNEDHCLDLITVTGQGLGHVGLGNCDGTFQAYSSWTVFGTGTIGFGLQVADMNGDGHLDVITSGATSTESGENPNFRVNLVAVLVGDGTGNVGAPNVYHGGAGMYSLVVMDLNNDGHLDAITADQDSDSATVYLNNGSGGFGDPSGGYLGYNINNQQGTLQTEASNFVSLDVNGDHKPDLVMMEYPQTIGDPWQIAVMLNDGTGHFGAPVRSSTGLTSELPLGDFVFGDFRNTGRMDFLSVGSGLGGPSICFARNNGDGTFATPTITTPPFATGIIATGDFNGDGKLDFALTSGSGGTNGSTELIIFLGNGDGTFTPGSITTFDSNTAGPSLIFSGDFNHDGKTDLLVWDSNNTVGPGTQHRLFELLGNGNGTFGAPTIVNPNLGPFALVDVNHDGQPDIVELAEPADIITSPVTDPPTFNIYLGRTDGSFELTNSYSPYSGQNGFYYTFGKGTSVGGGPLVADFDGDGNLDIAAYQSPQGTNEAVLQILLGNGDGTFTPSYTTFDFWTRYGVPGLAVDVDGDGRADLIEADYYTSSYDVIKAAPGPTVQLRLNTDPVIGTAGGVTITLPFSSSTSTTVSLAASDAAITIAPSVTIPAGSVSESVPFTIGGAFNPAHVFSIAATVGGQTHAVYGTQGTTQLLTMQIFIMNADQNVLPGQTTGDFSVNLTSVGGYASDPTLSCINLPAGATCEFGQNPLPLDAGLMAYSSLEVQVGSGVAPGRYQFSVIANDGSIQVGASPDLYVGDFQLSLDKGNESVPTGVRGAVVFPVAIRSLFAFSKTVTFTCSGLPAGAICTFRASETSGVTDVTVAVPNLPIGAYSFTITGTGGPLTHSLPASFEVGDFSGSIAKTTLSLPASTNAATTTVTINSLDGLAGQVELACESTDGKTIPISCIFNSETLQLPAGGSVSTVINLNGINGAELRSKPRIFATRIGLWGFGIVMVPAILAFVPGRKRRSAALRGVALGFSLVFLFGLASCGGSGGGGGGTGGNGGGGSGSTQTFSLTITARVENSTKTIGTIQVSVPQ